MLKKVIAIGDSFFAGAELHDATSVWPCLYANEIGVEFHNRSRGGCGSKWVLKELLSSIYNEHEPCLYILLWPYLSRRDYYDKDSEDWYALGPMAHTYKGKYQDSIESVRKHYFADMHSFLDDKIQNLCMIHHALLALQQTKHQWVMHISDSEIYETTWFQDDPVKLLQDQTVWAITTFEDDLNFVDWSKKHGCHLGEYGHPLEDAHRLAFEFFKPKYDLVTRSMM